MSARTPTLGQASLNEVGKHCGGGGRWLSPFKTSRETAGGFCSSAISKLCLANAQKGEVAARAQAGHNHITSTLSFAARRSGFGKFWLLITYDVEYVFKDISI